MVKRILALMLSAFMLASMVALAEEPLPLTDENALNLDADALSAQSLLTAPLADGSYLIDTLRLPAKGANGSVITWQSSDESVITNVGGVIRPADEDTEVTLTATLTYGGSETTKDFEFTVPALGTIVAGVPALESLVHGDAFENNECNPKLVLSNVPAGSFEVSGGKARLTRSSSSGDSFVRFYGTEKQEELGGEYYIEFVVSRTNAVPVLTRSYDATGQWGRNITSIDWRADGSILYYEGAATKTIAATSTSKTKMKMGIYFNSEKDKFSLWIDNQLVLDKISSRSDDFSGFRFMQFYMEGSNYTTVEFENYNLYKVAPIPFTDEEAVAADLAEITRESILTAPLADGKYLIDSLRLPSIGKEGSVITWESDTKSIIAPNGVVSRPLKNEAEVNLTAIVSRGSVSDTKTFKFTVAPLQSQPAGIPVLMGVVHGDDFEDGTFNTDLLVNNVNGGSIGVENGRLAFTRSSNKETYLRFYLSKNKIETEDKPIYMEFVTSRTKAVNVLTRSYDAYGKDGQNITAVDWRSDGSISYYDGTSAKTLPANSSRQYKMKWAFLIDTSSDTYSLWLDNVLVLENIRVRAEDASGFRYIQFYMDGSNYTTLNFESYRIYNVWRDMPDSERVALDAESVVYEKLLTSSELAPGTIDSDLSLPTVGANGTEIIWQSSNEAVISNDGTVTRPNAEGFFEVTLTATIRSGSESIQKDFTFSVPGTMMNIETDVGIGELICFNDFETEELDNYIATDARNYTDVLEIKDGKYHVTRTDNTNTSTYIRVFPTNLTSKEDALKGVIGVEFEMTRTTNQIVKAVLTSVEGTYLTVEWQENGNIILGQRTNAADTSYNWLSTNRSFKDSVRVKVLLDTRRSMYSLYLEGEQVIKDHYSRSMGCETYWYTEFTTSSNTGFTFTVDNHKVYYAIPPTLSRIDYDFCSVTEDSVLTKPPVMFNFIDAPLNLYKSLEFGSTVRWESSRPDVINPDTGAIARPMDTDSDIPVTVTAYVTNSGVTKSISFDFVVLRDFSSVEKSELAELERLDYSLLTTEDPSGITYYLNLMNKGIYGSDITWSTSNEHYITPAGRVIRPKWDESDVKVTLTATIACKYTKQLDFVVKADEKPVDKQAFTDEEFFGVWDGSQWTKTPVFNYEYEGLEAVEAAVKNGNYELAQNELFTYMKNRNIKSPVPLSGRNTPWVNSLVTGIVDMQASGYYVGQGSVNSAEYERIVVPISNLKITSAEVKNYDIIAKHNDTTEITIAGTDYPDEKMRPEIMVYVNGTPRYYKATASASVRTGSYMKTPYGKNDELKVKMFGSFLGDETYRTMLMFNFDDIRETDTVENGELTFYAKKSTDYSENKEFFVLRDPSVSWDEKTVCWNDLKTYVHNFNGIPGENHWQNILGSDVEYAYQSCRFYGYREMLREYLYTGDETYSYTLVKRMMDFINDTGSKGYYCWPRTLDTAVRLEAWIGIYNYFVDLKWVDAEINTAVIKNMYKAMLGLVDSNATVANWIQTEKTYAYYTAVLFPEFAQGSQLKKKIIDVFTENFAGEYYPDGAYIEDTGSYHTGALNRYITVRNLITNDGESVSPEYDELLRRGAYYVLFLRGPSGEELGYGDSGPGGKSTKERYSDLSALYNDYELKYIDTFGAQGTKPEWTSVHLPYSTYTFMRSDWSKNASYLFTNVRNGGTHGHYDDNGIIAISNGRNLLVDAGYVTYSGGEERSMAVSTNGHNTVSINDENHKSVTGYLLMYGNQGDVHHWNTNSSCDFLSQTTKGYTHIDNDHRRTITFVKPGFWIVSDLCTPKDKTEVNNYKQNWHTLPDSDTTIDENNVISTGFPSGENIKIAVADTDVTPVLTEGVYTSGYGQAVANPWAYYEKNVAGDASFDTVLLPYEGSKASINVEHIDLGVPTTQATALKFSSSTSDGDMTVYYKLDYEPSGERGFDKYISDGIMTVVTEDKRGNITQLILNGGSVIKTAGGDVLIDFGQTVTDAAVEVENGILKLVSSDKDIDLSKVEVYTDKKIDGVTVNGEYKLYTKDGVKIILSNENGKEIIINDNNANLGIKDNNQGSGGSGGAGGSGGSSGGDTSEGGTNSTIPFTDITDHWAKDYIIAAHSRGFVNGYGDSTYLPDSNITRAEFTALICRAFGIVSAKYDDSFADVADTDWFAGYVSAALSEGIVFKDINFRPNDTITREEMCKIISSAMQISGYAVDNASSDLDFIDASDISDWAAEYVRFAVHHGIMTGHSDGNFAPKANATRAEAATVLSRIKS